MQRIPSVEASNATGLAKQLLAEIQNSFGMIPNQMKVLANSPCVLEGFLNLYNALEHGRLVPELRQRILLAVSQANNCEYCLALQSAIAKVTGLSDEDIIDSRNARSPFSRVEAALQFALRLSTEKGVMPETEVDKMRRLGYSDSDLLEIAAIVAMANFTNIVNKLALTSLDFSTNGELLR